MRTRFAKRAARRRECACSDSRKATPWPPPRSCGKSRKKKRSKERRSRNCSPAILPRSWSTIPAHMAKRKAKKMAKRKTRPRKARSKANRRLPKNAVTLVGNFRARKGQDLLLQANLRPLVGPKRPTQDDQ